MRFDLERWYPTVRRALGEVSVEVPLDEAGLDDVEQAWRGLPAGGSLVVVDRSRRGLIRGALLRCGRTSRAWRYARRLSDVEHLDRFLVFPSTGGSHVLVQPKPARGFGARCRMLPGGLLRWRLLRRVVALAGRLGLAGRFGADELVVLHKAPNATTEAARDEPGFATETGPWNLSVSTGVPGPRRKCVVQLSDGGGDVRAFLKVAADPRADGAVRHERDVLADLHEREITSAPTVLIDGTDEEPPYFVQEALAGAAGPREVTPPLVELLEELARSTEHRAEYTTTDLWRETDERLTGLSGYATKEFLRTTRGLSEALRPHVEERALPCALSHGDLTPWNLVATERGLRAFDWEFARHRAPLLFDLFHFVVQTGVLVQHFGPRELLRRAHAAAVGPARTLWESRGLTEADVDVLLGAYVLFILVRDEHLCSIERPPFAQVRWLRHARMNLAHSLTGRLRATAPAPAGAETEEEALT